METTTTEINTRKYKLRKPAARAGMILSTRVSLLIGPVLAGLGGAVVKKGDSAAAIAGLASALISIDPEKLDDLFMESIRACDLHCEDQPLSGETDFERHFSVHKGDIYQVCLWTLTEAVSDFFPWLANFGQITDKLKEELKSQVDGLSSTGPEDHAGKDSAPSVS